MEELHWQRPRPYAADCICATLDMDLHQNPIRVTYRWDDCPHKAGRRRLPILLHPDAFLKRRMVINETLVLDLPPPSLHDLQREDIELLVERGPSFLLNGKI